MYTQPLTATAVPTPAGPLAVVITPEDGVVRGAGFESVDHTIARLRPSCASGGCAR